ncbi:MAG: hypothetical protein ACLTL2_23445, partial [Blautia sp.]
VLYFAILYLFYPVPYYSVTSSTCCHSKTAASPMIPPLYSLPLHVPVPNVFCCPAKDLLILKNFSPE